MKKRIALLLAAVMLLSMTACGGAAEPVETAPATTEAPATAPTEAPTEEPTTAPTEAPRVAPTDFEAVDPETLPEPIPVEEQLQSEDTQTVTLGSLEEYEDLLWELGFKEVRLAGTGVSLFDTEAWCEPVSLTYNNDAFQLEFVYCSIVPKNPDVRREEHWYMYGTKSCVLSNVSYVNEKDYIKAETASTNVIVVDTNTDKPVTEADLAAIVSDHIQSGENKTEEKTTTPNFEREFMAFVSAIDKTTSTNVLAVYYPVTGVLLNFAQDIDATGITSTQLNQGDYSVAGQGHAVGMDASVMCFHYIPDTETAE